MIKSILVAMDESQSSASALKVASEIARVSNAKLKGLYIEDIARLLTWQPAALAGSAIGASTDMLNPLPTEEQVEVEKEFVEERIKIKTKFDNACMNSEIVGPDGSSSFYAVRGRVDHTVVDEAKKVDLVVIGRRGKTYPEGSKEPGPTTEHLLRNTVKPVIVVPPKTRRTTKILVAYDGSESAQRALSVGAQFALLHSTSLAVVTVSDKQKFVEKIQGEAREFLNSYGLNVFYIDVVGEHSAHKGILEQSENFEAGLIVMGAYGENRLKELVVGSTTKNVLMNAQCPVLLCR